MNDIIINKVQSIQRCVERAKEEYEKDPNGFNTNFTHQDAAILNILRACELAIGLANHLIKKYKMGIPTSSSESFELLGRKRVIDSSLVNRLGNMVSFRNMVVHEYQKIDVEIVKSVIINDVQDLIEFTDRVLDFSGKNIEK